MESGLLLFDEVEVLDFAGPFEVFSVTAAEDGGKERPFEVKTISETGEAVTARNGLTVVPDFSIENAPRFDILIIPGGPGARNREVHNDRLHRLDQKRSRTYRAFAVRMHRSAPFGKSGIITRKKRDNALGEL